MAYWVGILQDQLPTVMEKAASSQGNSKEAVERAALFGQSLDACLSRYRSHRSQSSTVDRVELSDLFEVREELLREAGFQDVYRMDKERENAAALEALEALLIDLDKLDPPAPAPVRWSRARWRPTSSTGAPRRAWTCIIRRPFSTCTGTPGSG